jgi:hypothetical protein
MIAWLILGCGGPVEKEPLETPVPAYGELSEEVRLLTRASLDTRGRRPSVEELERVEEDPEALDAMFSEFLQDEGFGRRVRDLYSLHLLTRLDDWDADAEDFGIEDKAQFAASIGEAPLRILERIALEDRSYVEWVTGDWTMADEILGAIYPVDYPEGGSGWLPVSWTDGRPAAGVLSTNAMWWRYGSTAANANRGRANIIAKTLLCVDYLNSTVEFDRDVNLLDEEAVRNAISENPGCLTCHSTLEPLSSFLWGFYYRVISHENTLYRPEQEFMWMDYGTAAPGYFGAPGYTLSDLGWSIAADVRYPVCAVRTAYKSLLGRELDADESDALIQTREDFLAGGLTLRSLFKSVLASEPWRDDAVPRMVSPDLMASQVEALTGFRLVSDGYDLVQTDGKKGLRTLAGGVDGDLVTALASEPGATMLLVHQRLGEAAASHVVESDFGDPEMALLFKHVTPATNPVSGRSAMERQVQDLHRRLFGRSVASDGPEVESNLALWEDLYRIEADTYAAWSGLLAVLFRDPEFLFY